MGESQTRRRRRKQQGAPAQASKAAPAPEPAPAKTAELEELNFLLLPGGLLPPEGWESGPPKKGKTVFVDTIVNAHFVQWQSRNQAMTWQKVSNALVRALMREEHEMREKAKAEERATGVPVRPKTGPLYRVMREEMDRMEAEESGEIFD